MILRRSRFRGIRNIVRASLDDREGVHAVDSCQCWPSKREASAAELHKPVEAVCNLEPAAFGKSVCSEAAQEVRLLLGVRRHQVVRLQLGVHRRGRLHLGVRGLVHVFDGFDVVSADATPRG